MDKTLEEIAAEMADNLEKPYETAEKRAVGRITTADGRPAEVQITVQADDFEWISPPEDLEDLREKGEVQ